jgi:hypothetical protein
MLLDTESELTSRRSKAGQEVFLKPIELAGAIR